MRSIARTAILTSMILLAGCKPVRPVMMRAPAAPGDGAATTVAVEYGRLAVVLDKAVTRGGLLDTGALKKHWSVLDRQLEALALVGPTATPGQFKQPGAAGRSARLAYWYNARAGWSMKLALLAGTDGRIGRGKLERRRFPLDGKMMTLAGIDAILARDHDWRTVVAAPCVLLQRARLPQKPFAAEDIRKRIAERFNAYVDDGARLVADVRARQIRVGPVLWGVRRRAIEQYERAYGAKGATLTTALLSHVKGSAHRRLQRLVGYQCVGAPRRGNLAVVKEKE